MEHTKGPWIEDGEASINEIRLSSESGDYICSIDLDYGDWDSPASLDDDTTEGANARLILASPELLEALKRLVSVVDPAMNSYAVRATASLEPFFKEPVKEAKEAIAKAEGK